jgi:hypothetical protein
MIGTSPLSALAIFNVRNSDNPHSGTCLPSLCLVI